MANFLFEKYPNETISIRERFVEKETPLSLVMAAAEASNNQRAEELSDTESECASASASVESSKESANPRLKKRRESICAEKLSDDSCEANLAVIEKHESEAARINDILISNCFFSHLDEKQRKAVQDTLFMKEYADGEVIIRQGDDGDYFYCIDSGVVEIFINDNELNARKLVKKCQAGESFGELALLYGAPRAASCIASGNVRLWTLDRVSFKKILMKTTMEVRAANKGFLEMVPLFSNLDEYELMTISDALQEETFEDAEAVVIEGEAGDKFYLIKEGTVVCTKKQSDGSVEEVSRRLASGDYFGELALLTEEKSRQATVTAEGNLVCLSIGSETFNRLVCIKELLLRNMGTYNIK